MSGHSYRTRAVKSNMVPLPGMTNGQQQSSKRSSNTVDNTSKKQKSTQREVSPQQTTQIGPTEFELLLERIADMEESQKQKDVQQQQQSTQQQQELQQRIADMEELQKQKDVQLQQQQQQQQQSIQQQQVIHQQQQHELQQQLVRQQKQQEDAHHKHYALIDRLRIDLEREREEKSHFQSLNRTITDSGEVQECVNFMNTANKLPPGQKSPKTGHANIEPTVILPMTSQNSSRVNSPSLNYVNNIQLSQPSQQPLPQPHQIHQQLQPQIQQQQLMQPLPFINRKLPEFAGKPSDDFEAWEISSKKFLNQFPSKTETEKVGYLSIGVTGHAARVLAQSTTKINTTIDLFNVLRETFGNQSTIDEAMSDVRQQKGESVRIYFSRVKAILLAQMKENVPAFNTFLQHYFKLGLKEEIKEPLRKLFKTNVDDMLGTACQIETEYNVQKIS